MYTHKNDDGNRTHTHTPGQTHDENHDALDTSQRKRSDRKKKLSICFWCKTSNRHRAGGVREWKRTKRNKMTLGATARDGRARDKKAFARKCDAQRYDKYSAIFQVQSHLQSFFFVSHIFFFVSFVERNVFCLDFSSVFHPRAPVRLVPLRSTR